MRLEELLRHAAHRHRRSTDECLSDALIAEFAGGIRDTKRREPLLSHVSRCASCRSAVTSVARAISDPEIRRSYTLLWSLQRALPIALPAAAAALLVVLALPERAQDRAPTHRAPTIAALAEPVPVAPLGVVASARTLRWTPVIGADRYRVTLYDASSDVLYETTTAQALALLPEAIILEPGRSYLWKVEARTGWGRWSASELVEFLVR